MKTIIGLLIAAGLVYAMFAAENKTVNAVYILIGVVAILTIYMLSFDRVGTSEHMTISDVDLEALKNVASLYNSGTMTVTNLKVTGNSQLGQVNVRGNRIGVPGSGDVEFGSDGWLRAFGYDTNDSNRGGVAAANLASNGAVSTNNVNPNSGDTVKVNGNVVANSVTVNDSLNVGRQINMGKWVMSPSGVGTDYFTFYGPNNSWVAYSSGDGNIQTSCSGGWIAC